MCRAIKILSILLASIILLPLFSCRDKANRQRLEAIDGMMDSKPDSALTLLEAISPDNLSESDRYFYALLTIKAKDKAYVRHTSDSAINSVLEYYNRHTSDPKYPEALYYGGRVNSDLGDYPTALRYFQDALDQLPENTENQLLRVNVLSQTGRLLNSLNLYEEASKYLIETLKVDSILNDPYGLTYDHQLFGAIQLHLKNYKLALTNFAKAKEWASKLDKRDELVMDVYTASVMLLINRTDTALHLIQRVSVSTINPGFVNLYNATAAQIYLEANILDSAEIHAKHLLNTKTLDNKKIGYLVLLSPKMRSRLSSDSLAILFDEFYSETQNSNYDKESKAAIIQQAMFNYQSYKKELLKEKNKFQAEENKGIILTIIAFILVILSLLLFYKYIKNKKFLDFSNDQINNLKNELKQLKNEHFDYNKEIQLAKKRNESQKESILMEFENTKMENPLPEEFFLTDIYMKFKESLELDKPIEVNKSLWIELEDTIKIYNKNFIKRLDIITNHTITRTEINTAMLIKCNFTPTQIRIISGTSPGAISSRREKLSKKIYDKKVGNQIIDSLIKFL